MIFHAATGHDESAIATVQANVRKHILHAFVARGHPSPGIASSSVVLAPNSPLRSAVRLQAQAALTVPVPSAQVVASCPVVVPPGTGAPNEPPAKPKPRPPAHYLWAALIARIYEVFPLICPNCEGQMRITSVHRFQR